MNKNVQQLKLYIILAVLLISKSVQANMSINNIKSLQSEWVFQSAESGSGDSTVYYDLYNDYVEIYPTISVIGDQIHFIDKNLNKEFQAKFEASDHFIKLESPEGGDILIEWLIVGNLLYLEYPIKKRPENSHQKALLIYKQM